MPQLWRVWTAADGEPKGVTEVIDGEGDVWIKENGEEDASGSGDDSGPWWRCHRSSGAFSFALRWAELLEDYGPVHIVLPEQRFVVYDRELPPEING